MLDGEKFVSYTRVQSVVLQWHGQQPASFFLHRAFRSLLTDRTNVSANSVDMLKNETLNLSLYSDGVNLLSLYIFSVHMLFVTCKL